MHKLNSKKRRVDFEIYNEANSFFVSGGDSKGKIDCEHEGLVAACKKRRVIVVELDQDDGFIARVVLGELNRQEKEEWIELGSRRLACPDGTVVVSGGNAFVSDDFAPDEIDEDEGEFYHQIKIPKGEYMVNVYTHLPSVNGDRLTQRKGWKGFVPYFKKTRPKKEMPNWLCQLAEDANEEVDEYEEDQECISFVIQLVEFETGMRQSGLEDGFLTKMKLRLPQSCPLGIEPKGITKQKANEENDPYENEQEREQKRRFADPKDLKKYFKPYCEAVQNRDWETATTFFTPSLQKKIHPFMEKQFKAIKGTLAPLEDYWLDSEPGEQAIPRWKNGLEEGRNLVDLSEVTLENYIGDIRCQFGDPADFETNDTFGFVDSMVISTTEGPKLAGFVYY